MSIAFVAKQPRRWLQSIVSRILHSDGPEPHFVIDTIWEHSCPVARDARRNALGPDDVVTHAHFDARRAVVGASSADRSSSSISRAKYRGDTKDHDECTHLPRRLSDDDLLIDLRRSVAAERAVTARSSRSSPKSMRGGCTSAKAARPSSPTARRCCTSLSTRRITASRPLGSPGGCPGPRAAPAR